ncbi:DUF6939 family protein [Micromonospora sp. CA-111912]|uniref:DUF6939 family protein n=1 Tax=Micromonospora sp. CA-111912 TaxID=3239955 RepID=UPI003D8CF5CA
MAIEVASRRRSPASLAVAYPDASVADVTSRGPQPWVRLSPFYPHGDIPVPGSPGAVGQSVEGIWQALKVFETCDVDPRRLAIDSMRGIKRTSRQYGQVLGHRYGLQGGTLLPYGVARHRIYLPCYRWMLENKAAELIDKLARLSDQRLVVLLDYNTNSNVDDLTRPLSHAGLIQLYVEGRWPSSTQAIEYQSDGRDNDSQPMA